MYIADSILAYHLRNVYWIGGGACGGKSTLARHLAERHDMVLYNCDEHAGECRQVACHQDYPAIKRHFVDSEDYFNRPLDEFAGWLHDLFDEQFHMVVLDALKLAENHRVVVEGHYAPSAASRLSTYNHCLFLFAEPQVQRDSYFAREDKQDMLREIRTLKDPERIIETIHQTSAVLTERSLAEVKTIGLKYMIRTASTTMDEMIAFAEKHFELA
jgi:cytidylate kinase